jgi:hypothetical protein
LSRADWRRENVDLFIQTVYQAIKREKPWVKFGISPFGIWRPHYPRQITGFDAYDKLYCDSRTWLEEGWLDYCAPQLYWPVEPKEHSFPVLLQWWAGQNTRHRTLLAGMKIEEWTGVTDEAREAAHEIELTRRQPGASGEIFWHAQPLLRNTRGVADMLQHQVYTATALVPAMPWMGAAPPSQPFLHAGWERGEFTLNWQSSGGVVRQWVLQKKFGGHWTTEILPGNRSGETIKPGPGMSSLDKAALFAVDRFGNLSGAVIYLKPPPAPRE